MDQLARRSLAGFFYLSSSTDTSMRTYTTMPSKPTGICPYFDKIQFWVRNPLDFNTLTKLERACGRGGIHIENRPARFNNRQRQYRQRIELRQPSDQALRWLARRSDVLVNRAEITLDLIFNSRAAKEEAWDFLHQHLVRRWHGKSQEIRVFRSPPRNDDPGTGETRYDAGGQVRNRLVLYAEDHSRLTGELNCVHIESRVSSPRAIHAAGIESGQDLPEFDHRAFWKKRLLLYAVDRRRLGLLIRNRQMGTKRRSVGWMDSRAGEVYFHSYDTVQELIDKLRSLCRIRLALKRIPNDSFLPE
jgi:hypothetical protein